MIGIETIVMLVVYLLIAGLVFGLLFWLIEYVGREYPNAAPFTKIAKVVLVILIVLFLIGLLLDFAGHPIIRFRSV